MGCQQVNCDEHPDKPCYPTERECKCNCPGGGLDPNSPECTCENADECQAPKALDEECVCKCPEECPKPKIHNEQCECICPEVPCVGGTVNQENCICQCPPGKRLQNGECVPIKYACTAGACVVSNTGGFNSREECDAACGNPPPPPPPCFPVPTCPPGQPVLCPDGTQIGLISFMYNPATCGCDAVEILWGVCTSSSSTSSSDSSSSDSSSSSSSSCDCASLTIPPGQIITVCGQKVNTISWTLTPFQYNDPNCGKSYTEYEFCTTCGCDNTPVVKKATNYYLDPVKCSMEESPFQPPEVECPPQCSSSSSSKSSSSSSSSSSSVSSSSVSSSSVSSSSVSSSSVSSSSVSSSSVSSSSVLSSSSSSSESSSSSSSSCTATQPTSIGFSFSSLGTPLNALGPGSSFLLSVQVADAVSAAAQKTNYRVYSLNPETISDIVVADVDPAENPKLYTITAEQLLATINLSFETAPPGSYTFPLCATATNCADLSDTACNGTVTVVVGATPSSSSSSSVTLAIREYSQNRFELFPQGADLTYGNTIEGSGKFGGRAGQFTAGGQLISTPYSNRLNLGAADFTIEWWMYWESGHAMFSWSQNYVIGVIGNYAEADNDRLCLLVSSNGTSWDVFSLDGLTGQSGVTSISVPKNQWCHVAVTRAGNTWRMFIDGVDAFSAVAPGYVRNPFPADLLLGGWPNSDTLGMRGKLDEFRITRGVARYTSNFAGNLPEQMPQDTEDPHWSNVQFLAAFDPAIFDRSQNKLEVKSYSLDLTDTPTIFRVKYGDRAIVTKAAAKSGLRVLADDVLDMEGGDFTVEFWFSPGASLELENQTEAYPTIIATHTWGSPSGFTIRYADVRFGANMLSVHWFSDDPLMLTMVLDGWHHITFMRKGDFAYLFIDGVYVQQAYVYGRTLNLAQGGAFNVANSWDSNGGLNAHLDEIRITKGVGRYPVGFTPPTTEFADPTTPGNVALLLHMNPPDSSSSSSDSSSSSSSGTLTGPGAFLDTSAYNRHATAATAVLSTTQSKFGGWSAYFDGTTQINLPGGNELGLGWGDCAIEFWFYYEGKAVTNSVAYLMSAMYEYPGYYYSGTEFYPEWYIAINNQNKLEVNWSSNYLFLTSQATVPTNQWAHLALVYKAGELRLYLNGQLAAPPALNYYYGAEHTSYSAPIIGARVDGDYGFIGYIDEVRFSYTAPYSTGNFTPPEQKFPQDNSDPHWNNVSLLLPFDYYAENSSSSSSSSTAAIINSANYLKAADWNGFDGNATTVGTNGGRSYYGTYDQGGNVEEWSDTGWTDNNNLQTYLIFGGSWNDNSAQLSATNWRSATPLTKSATTGFRVASPSNPQAYGNFVLVNDAGNAPNPTYPVGTGPAIPNVVATGDVSADYYIGTYEVTNAEYAEFLNAIATNTDPNNLYDPLMGSSGRGGITRNTVSGGYTYTVKINMGNKPVNFVSWYSAARYTNWLHNGKPVGASQDNSSTEDGAYTMSTAYPTRNTGATYFLPSKDEWHKAAYYRGGGTNAGYWRYPTQCDNAPAAAQAVLVGGNGIPTPVAGCADCSSGGALSVINVTEYAQTSGCGLLDSPLIVTLLGNFVNNVTRSATFNVTGVGTLNITMAASCEIGFDVGYVYKNNVPVFEVSGSEVKIENLPVNSTDQIRLEYRKDSSVSEGSDSVTFSIYWSP